MPPRRKVGQPSAADKMAARKVVKENNIETIKNMTFKKLICKKCKKPFQNAVRFATHQKKCTKKIRKKDDYKDLTKPEKLPYCCNECNKKFKFKESFTEHLKNEHSTSPNSVSCKLCSAKCPDETSLTEHMTKVHQEKKFECPHCKKEFTRNYHVIRHLAQKGCDGHTTNVFECELCDSTFTRKDNLMYHLRNSHISINKFHCKQCDYKTQKYNKYVRHVMQVHSDEEPRFQCDTCGRVLKTRAAAGKHMEIHGSKKFVCDVCEYASHTLEVMKRHVLSHSDEKPFKCDFCPKSFIQVHQLRAHVQRHNWSCEVCDLSFTNRARLINHRREHGGVNTLNCPISNCPKKSIPFLTEESLNEHLKMHDTFKKYSCEVCYKSFHNEMTLKRHVLTHMLDRPRRCMYCVTARAYIRGDMLVRHVRMRHPAIFKEHLAHVREVMGTAHNGRVTSVEIEWLVNMLDAVQDSIFDGRQDEKILYAGMQEENQNNDNKQGDSPLMTEEELSESISKLLVQLIDINTLQVLGWPDESVDVLLEKVIKHCGQKAADRDRWSRVQCLRENAKHLFLHVIEDKTVSRMLGTNTIDQVVRHILNVSVDS